MDKYTERWYANEMARVLWLIENGRMRWTPLAPPSRVEKDGHFKALGAAQSPVPSYVQFKVDAVPQHEIPAGELSITEVSYRQGCEQLRHVGLYHFWQEFLRTGQFSSIFALAVDRGKYYRVRRVSGVEEELAQAAIMLFRGFCRVSPKQ